MGLLGGDRVTVRSLVGRSLPPNQWGHGDGAPFGHGGPLNTSLERWSNKPLGCGSSIRGGPGFHTLCVSVPTFTHAFSFLSD